ncbi:protease SohB [Kangiella koreensis]|uniref:Peptidase S49 domain protein n=1 Tax=Kangiella koreensis (strain DSM 16069 / JCM 12317 / KCTC 12182 / SW-125) TaxID=523791 RepID=C7RA79_KANKD|nr:protease SohB [Kangiella koreensis]ACV26198.1 Peptidase S49 domain protein [Kangiella koreensis DSM 16069]
MEFLSEYGLFLLKTATIAVVVIIIISMLISEGQRQRSTSKGDIKVVNLGETIKDNSQSIKNEILTNAEYKQLLKEEKERDKKQEKDAKQKLKHAKKSSSKVSNEPVVAIETTGDKTSDEEGNVVAVEGSSDSPQRMYVIDFEGDIHASGVESLREEVTAILATANKSDQVMIRLESPGGLVHSYGLAASQLKRIRDAGLKLTISVDEVAASGGYMMACVADELIAAPFAILGSIGVVAEIPNFNRLLQKANIDYEQHTAGQHKRTLTMFGQNTTASREKFKQELEETHQLFKAFIHENRPALDLNKVATGEHWYGRQALELGLVDKLQTSDDVILDALNTMDVYSIKYDIRKPLTERLSVNLYQAMDKFVLRWIQRSSQSNIFK